jgi:hypothetical protein
MNDVQIILHLIDRIDDFANLFHVGDKRLAVIFRRRFGQNQARVTVAPAAIIERDHKITGIGKIRRLSSQQRRRAAPTVGHDDRRQGFSGERFKVINIGVKARAFAVNIRRARFNISFGLHAKY